MAQTIKLKRSAVAGRIPTTADLDLGEVAINTYDGKMYMKKSVLGTETIVDITAGGSGSSAGAAWTAYAYTATAGQTTISGNDDNSQSLAYTPGDLEVFLNGILLDPDVDYTANNGSSVVLTEALELDDLVQINTFTGIIGSGDIQLDTFTGTGSQTDFTLSADPGDENNTFIYIDGVYQQKDSYTVGGTTLSFGTAPYNNASIEVLSGSRNVTVLDINDLSISGDFTAAGDVAGATATITGEASSGSVATGALTASTVDATGDISADNLIATSDVSGATATITGEASSGSVATGALTATTIDTTDDITTTTNINAADVIATGDVSGATATITGEVSSGSVATGALTATTIDTTDDITTTTDVNAANVVATGDVEASTVTLGDGVMSWNDIDGTVDIDYGDVTLQVGQEQHFYAKAVGAIANGDVVMFAGAQGDHVLVAKADHNSVGFKPEYIVGVATSNIANNEFGYVTSFGKVRGLDTSGYSEGDILYFDPTITGGLTTTRPTSPNHVIQMAAVLNSHQNEGTLLVRPEHFFDTDEVEEGSTNLYYTDGRVSNYLTTNNYATQSYVNTQIGLAVDDLVDSAPGTLDTLNELAAALNDDENFAATVNSSISANTTEIENAKAEAVAFAIALG